MVLDATADQWSLWVVRIDESVIWWQIGLVASPSNQGSAGRGETLVVEGQRLRLEWHDLEVCTVGLAHLDRVVSSLLTMPWGSGGAVLCAVDPTGRVVGAGGLEFTDTARAYGAVAVLRGWRHRGLGGRSSPTG